MDPTKPWYASRAVWGGVCATALPLIGLLLHTNLTDAQVQEIATDASLIGGAIAGLVAIWGRVRASKPISGSAAADAAAPLQAKGP